MKLTAEMLRGFLGVLPDYDRLTVPARRALAAIERPAQTLSSPGLGDSLAPLLDAGFLVPPDERGRCTVAPTRQDFLRVLRVFRGHSLFRNATEGTFTEYVEQVLTATEREALRSDRGRYFDRNRILYGQITSPYWVDEFLDAKRGDWERPYLPFGTPALFASADVLGSTQNLVRWLLDHGAPAAMREIPALRQDPKLSSPALHAALRYGLLFAEVDPSTMNVALGVWPSIAAHAALAGEPPPRNVVPTETWDAPFLLEDITTLLIACAAEPLRLRANDGQLFAKAVKDLSHVVRPLPKWVEEAFGLNPEVRVLTAAIYVRSFKFVEEKGGYPPSQLTIGDLGRRWLNLSVGDRLRTLLDGGMESRGEANRFEELHEASLGPIALHVYVSTSMKSPPDLDEAVRQTYRSLKGNGFFPVEEIVKFSLKENPLLAILRRDRYAYFSYKHGHLGRPDVEQLQQVWREVVRGFVPSALLPLNCVRLGRSDAGLSIAITPAGRYLLGQTKHWEWTAATDAQVIVQPNFEVTFLGEAPGVEAEIGRFAERRGRNMGALFQITKKSIFAASATGMTAGNVFETLERVCTREIPGNVRREIQGWFGQCRKVFIEPAMLIRCPDRETALRILSLAKESAMALSDTILEYKGSGKQRQTLNKKLRELGILVSAQEKEKASPAELARAKFARW